MGQIRSADGSMSDVFSLYDEQIERAQRISPIGGAIVEQTTRLVGTEFTTALVAAGGPPLVAASNFWSLAGTGTGVAATTNASSDGIAKLTGGTDAGYVQLTSVRKARFLFANPNLFRALVRLGGSAVAAAGCASYVGVGALSNGVPQSGYFFKIDALGIVSIQTYSASGALTLNLSTGWNGVMPGYTIPNQNMHAFEIVYYAAAAWFFIDGNLAHVARPTTALLVPDLSHGIAASTVTASVAAVRVLEVWRASILRMGKEFSRPTSTYIAANVTAQVLKTGPGSLHHLIVGAPVNAATIILYDAVSATNIIASFTLGGSETNMPITLDMGMDFFTGLAISTSGATKVTVVYD